MDEFNVKKKKNTSGRPRTSIEWGYLFILISSAIGRGVNIDRPTLPGLARMGIKQTGCAAWAFDEENVTQFGEKIAVIPLLYFN